MKFSSFASEVENLKSTGAKRTAEVSRAPFRRLTEHFGAMELAAINEFTWSAYVQKCKAENPTRRLVHDRKAMTTIMLQAFHLGIIERRIVLRIPDKTREIGREIAEDELTALLSFANRELHFQIRIALFMGLRLREMLGLRWDRIDWNTQTVNLRPEDTKTRRGRNVPIPAALFPLFRARFRRTETAFVFPSRFDPTKPQYENKSAWRRCRKRAGVTTARWHDLRHSCASVMLRLGVTQGVVAKYLGMSEQVLSRIYRHVNMEELRAAAEAINLYSTQPGRRSFSSRRPGR